MTNDHVLYEKIDLYLKNSLSEEETNAFKAQLSKDAILQELVETQRIANEVVYTKQLIALQTKIQADLNGSKQRYNFRSLLGIGSFAMVALGLFMYLLNSNTDIKTTTIPSNTKEAYNKSTTKATEPSRKKSEPQTSKTIVQPIASIATTEPLSADSFLSEKNDKAIINHNDPDPKPLPSTEIVSNQESLKIDCSHLNMDQAIVISSACEGEQNGKIVINPARIKGGTAPYLYSLHKKENLSTKNEYHYLHAGNYTVFVSDAHNCTIAKTIEVEEKVCKKINSFAFTPELEKWEIPVQENKRGILKIFNKSGILVYTTDVSSDLENFWDGTSSEGHLLETGYYTYSINYSEGGEEIGSISILRR